MKWVQKDGEHFLYDMNNQCIAEFCISKNNKLAMYVIHLNNSTGEYHITNTVEAEHIKPWIEDKVARYCDNIIEYYGKILNELIDY